MARRNQSIYAKTIENIELKKQELQPQDFFDETVIEKKRVADRYRPIQEFRSRAESVAKSTLFYKNYYYTQKHFKENEALRRVDKFFPNAVGGPLYVDEPQNPTSLSMAKNKKEVMNLLGLRYLIIEEDDSLFELLEKLGEIK